MENITGKLEQLYLPQKALLVYRCLSDSEAVYVEAWDMDGDGRPINAHPLSVQETISLADCLNKAKEAGQGYLECKGLLPEKLLCLDQKDGCATWHTPGQRANLLFSDNLHIPSGEASVPAMIWKADKGRLSVYAMKSGPKPKAETPLCHAPFFNIYRNGEVCMGTVDTDLTQAEGLEDFMRRWEQVFWNSYFSHLNGERPTVNGNIVQLWQGLVGTEKTFPTEVLKKNGKTLKDIF